MYADDADNLTLRHRKAAENISSSRSVQMHHEIEYGQDAEERVYVKRAVASKYRMSCRGFQVYYSRLGLVVRESRP
jgi:hypothetical protein